MARYKSMSNESAIPTLKHRHRLRSKLHKSNNRFDHDNVEKYEPRTEFRRMNSLEISKIKIDMINFNLLLLKKFRFISYPKSEFRKRYIEVKIYLI